MYFPLAKKVVAVFMVALFIIQDISINRWANYAIETKFYSVMKN